MRQHVVQKTEARHEHMQASSHSSSRHQDYREVRCNWHKPGRPLSYRDQPSMICSIPAGRAMPILHAPSKPAFAYHSYDGEFVLAKESEDTLKQLLGTPTFAKQVGCGPLHFHNCIPS